MSTLRAIVCSFVAAVCVLSGCGRKEASGLRYAKLHVESVFASASSASDPVVGRIWNEVLGAQGRVIVRGTLTDVGNPPNPAFAVGETIYIVTGDASVTVGREALFAAVSAGHDEYVFDGHKVIALEGGLYSADSPSEAPSAESR